MLAILGKVTLLIDIEYHLSFQNVSPDDMICSPLRVLQYCAITGDVASMPSRTTMKSGLSEQLQERYKVFS